MTDTPDVLPDMQAEARGQVAGLQEARAKIKRHSDTARTAMRKALDTGRGDEYNLWSCIVAHLDMADDAIAALIPANNTAPLG
jgi:hypothetical protein